MMVKPGLWGVRRDGKPAQTHITCLLMRRIFISLSRVSQAHLEDAEGGPGKMAPCDWLTMGPCGMSEYRRWG